MLSSNPCSGGRPWRACRMAGLDAIIFCITSGFCSMDCMTGEFIMFASPSPCSGMPPRRRP